MEHQKNLFKHAIVGGSIKLHTIESRLRMALHRTGVGPSIHSSDFFQVKYHRLIGQRKPSDNG